MAARSRLRFLPVALYVLLIFFVSSRPNLHPPGPDFEAKDKVAHFLEYFILGALLFKSIGWNAIRVKWANFVFLFAVGVSVGAFDELLQSYTPGRSMSVFDWIADALGVAIGVGIPVFSSIGRRKKVKAVPD